MTWKSSDLVDGGPNQVCLIRGWQVLKLDGTVLLLVGEKLLQDCGNHILVAIDIHRDLGGPFDASRFRVGKRSCLLM